MPVPTPDPSIFHCKAEPLKPRPVLIRAIELLAYNDPFISLRVHCAKGVYIRTLCADLGEALGVGANMLDLRRTRTASFPESEAHPLNAFHDALVYWREEQDEAPLRALLRPMESLLAPLPKIVVKDTAVDAVCHGANVHVPGVAKLSPHIRRGQLVGVFTGKEEAVALAKAMMATDEIVVAKSGVAADVARVLMNPGTYPKLWR